MVQLQARRVWWRAAMAACALLAPGSTCLGQFYPKPDMYEQAVVLLRDAVDGERPGTGALIGSLASLQDPELLPLFQAMMESDQPAARIYGILGSGLARGGTSFDVAAVLALKSPAERMVAVRESNATGLLRGTPVDELLASPELPLPTLVTLVGEKIRRGEAWKAETLAAAAKDEDSSLAGIASLLMYHLGDPSAWKAFRDRCAEMTEVPRSAAVRALSEGAVVFQIKKSVEPLLELSLGPGVADDAQMAAVGAALTLDPTLGLKAWQERVSKRRTQPQLVRAGMQLLAADEGQIPASAFDLIRNGTPSLDAIVTAAKALRAGGDPSDALINLLKVGHPVSGEWALLRARSLPPDQAAKVWRHVVSTMDSASAEDRPTPMLMSLAARELMKVDPAAVRALVDRAKNQPVLAISILSGIYDSGAPEGAEVARALRGSLPRAGESLAALVLARANAPMSDDDLDVLGRAAAGGGDLENMRAAQAAWYYIKRRNKVPDAVAKIAGSSAGAKR